MKVVYNNPVLELTREEKSVLSRASGILESICDKVDDYAQCENHCPIYEKCPYHNDFTAHRKIHDLLVNVMTEAEREEE